MTEWTRRLENPVSARLRDPAVTGYLALVLAVLASFLAIPPIQARTVTWPDHSHLFAVGDLGGWSVDEDADHLAETARRLGYAVGPSGWARFALAGAVAVRPFGPREKRSFRKPWLWL